MEWTSFEVIDPWWCDSVSSISRWISMLSASVSVDGGKAAKLDMDPLGIPTRWKHVCLSRKSKALIGYWAVLTWSVSCKSREIVMRYNFHQAPNLTLLW